jgi:hypothetical protein
MDYVERGQGHHDDTIGGDGAPPSVCPQFGDLVKEL